MTAQFTAVQASGREIVAGARRSIGLTTASTSGRWVSSSRNPARVATSVALIAAFLVANLWMLAPASAQATPGVADYIPETALFSAEFELDPESAQVTLGAELLVRANLEGLLAEEDMAEVDSGLAGLSLLASGEAAVFLTDLPVEEDLTLDDITSDAADVTTDPESALGGDVPQGWAVVLLPENAASSFDLYSSLVFEDETIEIEETEYNGYTIMSKAPADEYSEGAAIALVDDAIAVATVPEDLEAVIDTAAGDVEPLSGSASYIDVHDALEEEVLNFGYINGPAMLEALVAQDPEATASLTEDLTVSLGSHQGFVFWADEPGFRLDTIALAAEGAEIPAATAFEPAFTANVPDTSQVYMGGADLGASPALNSLALLFAQEMVAGDTLTEATPIADVEAQADEIFAETEGILGFNLKTDVLDQLVGEWAMAGSVENITDLEPSSSAIFVTEVEDDETVTSVVSTITNMIASQSDDTFTLATRDVNGSEVTVVDLSDSGTPLVLEFGVIDEGLVIGVNEGIDDFVGGTSSTLADDPTFNDTFAELPADVTSISYVSIQSLLPLIEDAIALSASSSTLDADPACGDYATQAEAQAAYDEDDFENFNLDLDYDGEACEDFFSAATPEAGVSGIGEVNVLSVGSVTFNDGERVGSSTIILIGE